MSGPVTARDHAEMERAYAERPARTARFGTLDPTPARIVVPRPFRLPAGGA